MGIFDRTQYSYWKTNQSYNLFWILSVLGGILALDHLYLRSPITFLAKLIVNIFGLGIWWIYDATQASFNKDVVKMYGLGIPGMGPMGIGAGSLASDKPDPKHATFLVYSLAVIFGGLFGVDSFVTGDKQTGLIRLICLISVIFTPIAIVIWLFKMGKFFFKTESVIEQYWEYFGAPKPEHLSKPFLEQLGHKFPFLQGIIGFFTNMKSTVTNLAEHPLSGFDKIKADTEAAITAPIRKVSNAVSSVTSAIERDAELPFIKAENALSGITGKIEKEIELPITKGEAFIKDALGPVQNAIQSTIGPIVQPITSSIQGAEQVAQEALSTTDHAIALGKEGLQTVKNLGEGAINALKSVGQLAALPGVAATAFSSVTPEALKEAAASTSLQQGGQQQQTPYLVYAFIGTIALIAVSGLVKTYQRLRQNKKQDGKQSTTVAANGQKRDDTPPEPRAV